MKKEEITFPICENMWLNLVNIMCEICVIPISGSKKHIILHSSCSVYMTLSTWK